MSIVLNKKINNIEISKRKKKTIKVFIAGIGAVGGSLINLIRKLDHSEFYIHIAGICNSNKVIYNPESNDPKTGLIVSGENLNWEELTDSLVRQKKGNLVFIDATGNESVARHYLKLLSHGVHIVTPSKHANTFEQSYFDELVTFPAKGLSQYKYETTVGAGLPVLKTIQSLVESGDKITKISGVVSGTMTYIFNQLQKGNSFSEIVKEAKELGYSEPDPRDDLSGEDVARKFLILARTSGFTFERADIKVESLIPDDLKNLSLGDFLTELPAYDKIWKNRHSKALVNNKKLRYTGVFTAEGINIGVQEVPSDSPLGNLSGTDNLIQIYSKRYAVNPIVIQGPGAGKEVTAAGVLSDILEIGRFSS